MGVIIATVEAPVKQELPEITTLDLSDLLSAQEREAEIERRDADAALNLAGSAWDVLFFHASNEFHVYVPDEPAYLREMCDMLYP